MKIFLALQKKQNLNKMDNIIFPDGKECTDGLYLGNIRSATNINQLEQFKIGYVLSMLRDSELENSELVNLYKNTKIVH